MVLAESVRTTEEMTRFGGTTKTVELERLAPLRLRK